MAIQVVESRLKPETVRVKRTKGMTRIGYGAFASVYAKGKSKEVIKFGYETDAYMHFVNQVGLLNPCIHVPDIYNVDRFFYNEKSKGWGGKPQVYKQKFYFVKMERLLKWRDLTEKQRQAALKRAGVPDIYELCRPGTWKVVSPHTTPFKQIMQRTFKGHGHDIDLHDGNVMFRHRMHGKHDVYDLVVTDPLC